MHAVEWDLYLWGLLINFLPVLVNNDFLGQNYSQPKFDVHFMYLPNVNFNDNFQLRKSDVKLICLFVFFRWYLYYFFILALLIGSIFFVYYGFRCETLPSRGVWNVFVYHFRLLHRSLVFLWAAAWVISCLFSSQLFSTDSSCSWMSLAPPGIRHKISFCKDLGI